MLKRDRYIAGPVILAVVLGACMSCARRPSEVTVDSRHRVLMGTFSRMVVVAPDVKTARKGIEAAFAVQRKVDSLMSYQKQDSELNAVNRGAHVRAVRVSEPIFEVLDSAMRFSKISDGAFDATVGPLVDLWRAAGEANALPSEAELAAAQAKVGSEKVILDPNERTVRFAVEGMRLDLGGIAKGYAIDKSVEALRQCGVVGGMVDIGGDVRCFGKGPHGKTHWTIGVQDPNRPAAAPDDAKPILVLRIQDAAVATSGGYQRFATIQGTKHSHIIDRRTGRSSETLASVTIIAPDATAADALATAVSILGAEKGLALIEKTPETEAILISAGPDYKITQTTRAGQFIK